MKKPRDLGPLSNQRELFGILRSPESKPPSTQENIWAMVLGEGRFHEVGPLSLSGLTSPICKMGFELNGLQSLFKLEYSIKD